jgi:hypothetical protein
MHYALTKREVRTMSVGEAKSIARKRAENRIGECLGLTVFRLGLTTALVVFEMLMCEAVKYSGLSYLYDVEKAVKSPVAVAYWVIKLLFEFVIIYPFAAGSRRLYLDIANDRDITVIRKYINEHFGLFYRDSLRFGFVYNTIKITVAVPAFIGAYGIYHWGGILRSETVSSWGLVWFTLSLMFTVAWVWVTAHYYISLSLAPYFAALNPRANAFDTCDLSVRLMKQRHGEYLSFVVTYLPYLLVSGLIYPFFGIYPVFRLSYVLWIQQLMGDFCQDKIPVMIRRWDKYHHRSEKASRKHLKST